jgi:hypothetical protein
MIEGDLAAKEQIDKSIRFNQPEFSPFARKDSSYSEPMEKALSKFDTFTYSADVL